MRRKGRELSQNKFLIVSEYILNFRTFLNFSLCSGCVRNSACPLGDLLTTGHGCIFGCELADGERTTNGEIALDARNPGLQCIKEDGLVPLISG